MKNPLRSANTGAWLWLDEFAFRDSLAGIARYHGFTTQSEAGVGNRWRADLILERGNDRILVEVKTNIGGRKAHADVLKQVARYCTASTFTEVLIVADRYGSPVARWCDQAAAIGSTPVTFLDESGFRVHVSRVSRRVPDTVLTHDRRMCPACPSPVRSTGWTGHTAAGSRTLEHTRRVPPPGGGEITAPMRPHDPLPVSVFCGGRFPEDSGASS